MSDCQRDLAEHREQLARLLRPQTDSESWVVSYLAHLTISQPELVTMIERRLRASGDAVDQLQRDQEIGDERRGTQ